LPALVPFGCTEIIGSEKGVDHPAGIKLKRSLPCRYGCIIFERGDVTLAEHWRQKRHQLSDIQKQEIIHQVVACALSAVCRQPTSRPISGPGLVACPAPF